MKDDIIDMFPVLIPIILCIIFVFVFFWFIMEDDYDDLRPRQELIIERGEPELT